MKILILSALLFCVGCAHEGMNSPASENEFGQMSARTDNRALEQFPNYGKNAKYWYPPIQAWSNPCSEHGVARPEIQLLDLDQLRGSLGLSYEESIHLQGLVNFEMAEKGMDFLALRESDRDLLFDTILNRVKGEVRAVPVPDFGKLYVMWLDPYLQATPMPASQLRALLSTSSYVAQAPIALYTRCLGQKGAESWLKGQQIEGVQTLVSAEFQTLNKSRAPEVGSAKMGEREAFWGLDLDQFFPKKEITLLVPKAYKGIQLPYLVRHKKIIYY